MLSAGYCRRHVTKEYAFCCGAGLRYPYVSVSCHWNLMYFLKLRQLAVSPVDIAMCIAVPGDLRCDFLRCY